MQPVTECQVLSSKYQAEEGKACAEWLLGSKTSAFSLRIIGCLPNLQLQSFYDSEFFGHAINFVVVGFNFVHK